jgi:hypothetical protein
MTDDRETGAHQPANLRTALVLLSIALLFFAGVIAKRMLLG